MTDYRKAVNAIKARGGIDTHAKTVTDWADRVRVKKQYGIPGLDTYTGAPAGVRAASSIKMTTAGKVGYLKNRFGDQNVQAQGDDIFYKPPGSEQWVLFDEERVSLRDFADLAGPAIEAVPGLASGIATANPLVAAGVDAAGNVVRQGISGLMPGEDEMTLGDRALSTGIAGVAGGVSQAGSNLAAKVVDKMRPGNLMRNYTMPAGSAARRAEVEAIEQATDVPFSVATLSGGRGALMVEELLRRHPLAADMVHKMDLKRVQALDKYFQRTLDDVGLDLGKEGAGHRVSQAYEAYVEKLVKNRALVADGLFGEVTKMAPDQRLFDLTQTRAALEGVLDKYTGPLMSDDGPKILTSIIKRLDALDDVGNALTPHEFKIALSSFGNAAAGKENVIKDLASKSVDRAIAAEVFGALLRDLDDAAFKPGVTAEVALALQTARSYYRAMSDQIGDVAKMTLAKTVGQPGEKISDKFISGSWAPSQIKENIQLLNKVDPLAAKAIKRETLTKVLRESEPVAVGLGALEDTPLSPGRLVRQAKKNRERIQALFVDDAQGLKNWLQGVKAAELLADSGMAGMSPTAPLQWTRELVNSLSGAFLSRSPTRLAGDIAGLMAPGKMAKFMLDPEAAPHVRQMIKTGNTARAVVASVAALEAIDQREDLIDKWMENAPTEAPQLSSAARGGGFLRKETQ